MSLFLPKTHSQQNSRLLGYQVQTSIFGKAIPIGWGRNRISGNLIWLNDWQAHTVKQGGKGGKGSGGKGGSPSYTYTASIEIALIQGVVGAVVRAWQDRTLITGNPLSTLGLTLLNGAQGQSPWSYLSSSHADQALGYTSVACVAKQNADLGTAGTISNYGFELDLPRQFNALGGIYDANPKDVINDILTNTLFGISFPAGVIGDLTELSNWCVANGLFLSPVLDSQVTAGQFIDDTLNALNCAIFQSEAQIKFRTYGDTAITGNGVTFTPNTTAAYSLNDDDFIGDASADPVQIERQTVRDAYNYFPIEWTNRANQYNTEPAYDQDDAAVQTYGLRPAPSIRVNGCTTVQVAKAICNLAIKRSVYQRAQYTFKLSQRHILPEPMDLLAINDPILPANTVVRIISIEEDDQFVLTITAEEFTGTASVANHGQQTNGGSSGGGYSASPNNVNTPLFFQTPLKFNNGVELRLRIGLSGGPAWGGCSVWASDDGTTYTKVGIQRGPSTMGVLSANLSTGSDPDLVNTLAVNLTESFGALPTYTHAQADALIAPFVVEQEMGTYGTANLTDHYAYGLTYLRRGIYGTAVPATHAAGAPFCMIDDQMFLYAFPVADIGKVRHFKFTSFNKAGQNEQDIATVTDYTVTLGSQRLPVGNGYVQDTNPPTTYTPDLNKGSIFDLTLAAATAYTINAPTSGDDGDDIAFILRVGAGATVTWAGGYVDTREIDNRGNIYRVRFIKAAGAWLFNGEIPSL